MPGAGLQAVELPALLMRRAGWVAAAVLALALLLGLLRMREDIDAEAEAAIGLASVVARLATLSAVEDARALADLRALQDAHPLRHLVLRVHDSSGTELLAPVPRAAAGEAWMAPLLAMHRWIDRSGPAQAVRWSLERPGGGRWAVSLEASQESERREAMGSLMGMLALLALCVAGLLLAMRWNLRRALAPLDRLLQAIVGIEAQDVAPVQALPTMPVAELERIAVALRHLGGSLEQVDAERRRLSRQMLTLQEDERARLARELHDEFAQRLTALRADAAWLARRVDGQPELQAVVQGMSAQCRAIHHDVRDLLARLQVPGAVADGSTETLATLRQRLEGLVAAWAERPAGDPALQWILRFESWPDDEGLGLGAPLSLAIYRLSQEALTNIARHAGASRAELVVGCEHRPSDGDWVVWRVTDDGIGLGDVAAAQARGNGLAGMRQRAWAHGSELRVATSAQGVCLSAAFRLSPPSDRAEGAP